MDLFSHLDPAAYELPQQLYEQMLTPALTIHLPEVNHNIKCVIQALAGDINRWRPHLKTTKIPQIYELLCVAGIRNFKCATTREAYTLLQVLRARDIRDADLLLAHPLIECELLRLQQLAEHFPETTLSVLCEDPEHVDQIDHSIGIFVDVNPGMNRSGVPLDNEQTIYDLSHNSGDRFRGIHFYDGHIRDDDPTVRRRQAFDGYARLICLLNNLKEESLNCAEVVTSGTLTFLDALAYGPFELLEGTTHRVSPGTVVFHDANSQRVLADLDLRPAALVRTRAISQPAPDVLTCNAGSKSIAAETGDPCCVVLGNPNLVALHPSEEHLPLHVKGKSPVRGSLISLIPMHVCPTVNLAEEAILIDDDGTFSVAQVRARAHELLLDDP